MCCNTILLIDDNCIDNFIHQHLLKKNHSVGTVTIETSAIAALDYLKTTKVFPNYIFLDINMPSMNGFEFLREYHKFGAKQKNDCSIIMLTSSKNKGDIATATNDPYIKKFLTKSLTTEMVDNIIK